MVEQGIHIGLGMEEYHSWKLDKGKLSEGPISCSTLKAFDRNPFAWLNSPEFKPTPAMRLGSLFDAAVTDPETLTDFVVSPFDSFRSKDAGSGRLSRNNTKGDCGEKPKEPCYSGK